VQKIVENCLLTLLQIMYLFCKVLSVLNGNRTRDSIKYGYSEKIVLYNKHVYFLAIVSLLCVSHVLITQRIVQCICV